MTQFIKFPDEQTAIAVLAQFRGEDEQGNPIWLTGSHTHALDIVGTIYKPTGVMLPSEEGEVPEMAPVTGFHVNFIGELPEEALAYVVVPNAPVRMFA